MSHHRVPSIDRYLTEMGHVCVSVCHSLPVPCALCLFLGVPFGLTHTAPRPTSHVDGDGVPVRAHRTRRQQTTHNTHSLYLSRPPARTHAIRRQGNRRQSGKDTHSKDIIIIHHHFTVTLEMSPCRFFPSPAYSESSPSWRMHPMSTYSTWRGYIDTTQKSSRLTRLTPLPRLPPGVSSLCTSHPNSESGAPCPSSSPLCGHCPRGTSVPGRPSLVQPCLALPALPCPSTPLSSRLPTHAPCVHRT